MYERIQLEHALDALDNSSAGLIQSIHQWNEAVKKHPLNQPRPQPQPLTGRESKRGSEDGACEELRKADLAQCDAMYHEDTRAHLDCVIEAERNYENCIGYEPGKPVRTPFSPFP